MWSKFICYRQFKSTKDAKCNKMMNHTLNKLNDTNCSDSAKRFCWHHYIMWSNGVVVNTSDFESICLNRRFYSGIFWKGAAFSKFSPMVAFFYIFWPNWARYIFEKKRIFTRSIITNLDYSKGFVFLQIVVLAQVLFSCILLQHHCEGKKNYRHTYTIISLSAQYTEPKCLGIIKIYSHFERRKKWRSDQSRDCDFSLSNWFTYII